MNRALEDLQAGKDPFAASRNDITIVQDPPQPFCFRAAKLAVWLPFIGAMLWYGGRNALEGVTGVPGLLGRLVLLGVYCITEFAGFILGIIALCGIPQYGPDGLLWRGIRSVVSSLIFMGLFATATLAVVHIALENRKALLAMREVAVRARTEKPEPATPPQEQVKPIVAPAQPPPPTNTPPDPSLVVLPQAAADDPLIGKAVAACTQKMMGLAASYASASKALQTPPVLDMSMITRREQLFARKDLVKKFLSVNEKLENMTANADDVFRKELEQVHCSPEQTEALLDAYRRSTQDRRNLILKLRNADERRATAMLGILDVMDSSFGQWKFDQDAKRLLFTDGGALHNYLTYRESMDTAAADQKKLQALVSPPVASL